MPKMSSSLVDAKLKMTLVDLLSVTSAAGVDVEAAALTLATGAARAGGAAERGVGNDQCGVDRGGAPRQDREAAACAVAPIAARPAGAADGLIAEQGAVGQSQRTIVREHR